MIMGAEVTNGGARLSRGGAAERDAGAAFLLGAVGQGIDSTELVIAGVDLPHALGDVDAEGDYARKAMRDAQLARGRPQDACDR